MAFPETRLTLIGRISAGGSEADWQQFLGDYWTPVCQFAARHASLSSADAEDVASTAFEALLTSNLLQRWHSCTGSKLRTLLCRVVRNVLSNRARVDTGRRRLIEEELSRGGDALEAFVAQTADEPTDLFYVAWVEQLLQTVVDQVMNEFHSSGKGDYFRVLFGRVCEGMSMPEISAALGIKLSDAENYYRAARKRLGERLQEQVRKQVVRYSDPASVESEFANEWQDLGVFLQQHGGLEQTLQRLGTLDS